MVLKPGDESVSPTSLPSKYRTGGLGAFLLREGGFLPSTWQPWRDISATLREDLGQDIRVFGFH
jgi:hypothetical protein